jgi:glutamine synthetase
MDRACKGVEKLRGALARAEGESEVVAKAQCYCQEVKPAIDTVRQAVDGLEGMVDADLWPLPKYREMLFLL